MAFSSLVLIPPPQKQQQNRNIFNTKNQNHETCIPIPVETSNFSKNSTNLATQPSISRPVV